MSHSPNRSVQLFDAITDRSNDVGVVGLSCNQWRLQCLLELEFAPVPFFVFRQGQQCGKATPEQVDRFTLRRSPGHALSRLHPIWQRLFDPTRLGQVMCKNLWIDIRSSGKNIGDPTMRLLTMLS